MTILSETKITKPLSQIESTPFVEAKLTEWGIQKIKTPDDLVNLRTHMYASIKRLPYTDETAKAEENIRWKRTGAQVLEDAYVYKRKSCTDLIVAFTTLVIATGLTETRFVKLKNSETGMLHSVAEFMLPDGWYIFDVSDMSAVPVKGQITKESPYIIEGVPGKFLLWQKGRDSWDLGLTNYISGLNVQVDQTLETVL